MAYNQELAQRIRKVVENIPGIVEKRMFGGVGYLLNGNMACGVNGELLIVRLNATEAERALKEPGVRLFDMTGRPMKGWLTVDVSAVADDGDLAAWVQRSIEFARKLPPK